MPTASRKVRLNGLDVSFDEAGTGPLVLLCHGFPETSYAWRHQVTGLAAAGFQVVAPNLPGVGASSGFEPERYNLVELVGHLVGLLDALGSAEAVIVGNDWGASLAWQSALLRPDRFRAVAALGVPMMGQPPVPPTSLFPQSADELFYTLYFQQPGVAEAEFERDVELALRKIIFAASGDAGPRIPGDGTPNPFGMVLRERGLLAPLPIPAVLPDWLSDADLKNFAASYRDSGFTGALNLYRNLDRNWRLQHAFSGLKVVTPALYIVGERDPGLSIPGMDQIIAAMPTLVPGLRKSIVLPGCGHWAPQEKPDEVNVALIEFLTGL